MSRIRFTLDELLAALGAGETYRVAFRHGTLELGLYAPVDRDDQQPHDQDEVYVVASGSGRFRSAGVETVFGPGDALFVPAGTEHRFVEFSPDTRFWVIFYGPAGGESVDS